MKMLPLSRGSVGVLQARTPTKLESIGESPATSCRGLTLSQPETPAMNYCPPISVVRRAQSVAPESEEVLDDSRRATASVRRTFALEPDARCQTQGYRNRAEFRLRYVMPGKA